jgi:CTP synthase (UTP-ammonia lyase)
MTTSLAIIADFDSASPSHVATNEAVAHSAESLGLHVAPRWIHTAELARPEGVKQLRECNGFWIGPGSPYASMDGALAAIRFAREQSIPLLGTCGGFQHIILEYARNVLGFADAEHGETAPQASRLFVSRLACSLVGRTMTVRFEPGSVLPSIYGRSTAGEKYLCNFGVNPTYVDTLRSGSLKAVASDAEGAIRAVELPGHPFFIGTLFLPQHSSSKTNPHPLISAFLHACLRR